ncbi:hypothetical protein ADL03_03195 [Nocardia sp. NRRL S-836]|nr:hypothetical protein ADL03_03195 [Nocardia sp. NRRL S-836]
MAGSAALAPRRPAQPVLRGPATSRTSRATRRPGSASGAPTSGSRHGPTTVTASRSSATPSTSRCRSTSPGGVRPSGCASRTPTCRTVSAGTTPSVAHGPRK